MCIGILLDFQNFQESSIIDNILKGGAGADFQEFDDFSTGGNNLYRGGVSGP